MSDEMIKTLPLFMRKSKIYKEVFDAEDKQFENLNVDTEEIRRQMSVDTATWGLRVYEKELGIRGTRNKSYRERREKIKSKMRSMIGKVDAELLRTVAQSFIHGEVAILFEGGRLKIHFNIDDIDTREYHKVYEFRVGMTPAYPDSENGFENVSVAIEEVKPAHLRLVFSPQVTTGMVFSDSVTMKKRTYHTVSEFKVGMTPFKNKSEVTL